MISNVDNYDECELNKLHIQGVSNSFLAKYTGFPTVKIQRGDKVLIQQRQDKDELLKHIANKYPDWEIVLSNCC